MGKLVTYYFTISKTVVYLHIKLNETNNNNMKHHISILPSGYGHFEVTTSVYGKDYTFITTDTLAIDDYNSEEGERCFDSRELRVNRGYRALRSEAMRRYTRK